MELKTRRLYLWSVSPKACGVSADKHQKRRIALATDSHEKLVAALVHLVNRFFPLLASRPCG